MEDHLRQLKRQHTGQLQNMQSLMDKQSDQIDSLLAELQSAKALHTKAHHKSDAAEQQLESIRQKWMIAKQEAESERTHAEKAQRLLHTLEAELQKAVQKSVAASDREQNLQQQIHKLRSEVAKNTSDGEVQSLQTELELTRQQTSSLKVASEKTGQLSLLQEFAMVPWSRLPQVQ